MLHRFKRRLLGQPEPDERAGEAYALIRAELAAEFEKRLAAGLAEAKATVQEEMAGLFGSKMDVLHPWKHNLFIPSLAVHPKIEGEFMAYSTCSARDFFHPSYEKLSNFLDLDLSYHRKYWEWVFVLHHLSERGVIGPGRRGLGFGVGMEPLPSAFAKMGAWILATDAPPEIGIAQGWQQGGQFASSVEELHNERIVDRSIFLDKVRRSTCDMNAIDDSLTDFDFCWSSCSLEHLGDIQKGLDFVVNSVERTLKVGGIACHTTELNLASNTGTVASGATVLYRKADLEELIIELRQRGHEVSDLRIAPDAHVLDFYVDTPPYSQPPHLKLALLGYASTSVGLIIRRGR